MNIQIPTNSVNPKYMPTYIALSISSAFPLSIRITDISWMQRDSRQREREESRLAIFNFCSS